MKKGFAVIVAALMMFAACKKESQPAEENENELITTIQVELIERGTGNAQQFVWEDADGPGGEIPYLDTIKLKANTTEGLPLGLQSVWNSTSAAQGTILVVLRHYPEGGKAVEDPVNSTKSTSDAGAVFNVLIGN